MTIKISDFDALDKMAQIEGPRWKKLQFDDKNSPFGFFAYLAAWNVIVSEGEVGKMTPHQAIQMDMIPGISGSGDGAIYGEGGYNRYFVGRDGIIKFDYKLARKEKQELARNLGFAE